MTRGVPNLKTEMKKRIRSYSDDKLKKELFFAEGFSPYPNDPNAQLWLELLLAETMLRGARV